MPRRFLDPRAAAHHKATLAHQAAVAAVDQMERKEAALEMQAAAPQHKRGAKSRAHYEAIGAEIAAVSAEKTARQATANSHKAAMRHALTVPAWRKCFKCDTRVNMASQEHFRLTLVNGVHSLPGDLPQLEWIYFTHPSELRNEASDAGVIKMLVPPDTGEILLCMKCAEFAQAYWKAQEV